MSVKRGDIYGVVGLITRSAQLQAQVFFFSEPVLMSQAGRVREIVVRIDRH